MNIASRDLIDKAVEHLCEALTLDCKGRFLASLSFYLDGIPMLLQASRDSGVSPPVQELLKAKCKQYLARVQEIRDHTGKGEDVHIPPNKYVDLRQFWLLAFDESTREVFTCFSQIPPPVPHFNDFIGQNQCKDFLERNIILPLKFPGSFDKVTRVKRGILLYGLPGVGKTFLIQATLASVSCPFLRISSSDLCSHAFGADCMLKLVQDIFEWAESSQPCILCFEDLDVLCHPHNNNPDSVSSIIREELTSRLRNYSPDYQVTVIGSTQKPWYLTGRLVRKFDRRFLLTLPELDDRIAIFKQHLADVKHELIEEDFRKIGEKTENFTSADLTVLARDLALQPVRHVQNATHFKKIVVVKKKNGEEISETMLASCTPDEPGALEITWEFVNANKLHEPMVTLADVEKCLSTCLPSCQAEDMQEMAKWAEEFGQED